MSVFHEGWEHKNLLISPDENGIQYAASLIASGQLVAFPTETVYGLGANALNEQAVRSIFIAKGRPLTDPLIVHVAEKSDALQLVELDEHERIVFELLGTKFWPGPLTMIATASKSIPSCVTAETGFVGVRCPAHPLAIALLKASKLPIAAPSANRFGHVSPTKSHHVIADLGDKNVRVLDGDDNRIYSKITSEHGIESTVVKLDGAKKRLCIFREGAVTQRNLFQVLCENGIDWSIEVVSRVVKMSPSTSSNTIDNGEEGRVDGAGQEAPGQAVSHYSPDVPCFIVASTKSGGYGTLDSSSACDLHQSLGVTPRDVTLQELSTAVIIDFGGQLTDLAPLSLAYKDLSTASSAAEAARNLFEYLRWAELVPGANLVFIAAVSSGGERASTVCAEISGENDELIYGLADRVFRAASGIKVHLNILPP